MSLKRLCIAILMGLTVCSPRASLAAGKIIAAMMSNDQPRYREAHRALVKSLTARGYTAATTEIILQTPNPDLLSWSNTIRKFNAYKPHLIVAYGAPAAQVAMKEAQGIPVLSVDMFGPEQSPPGVCGVSSRVPMITLLKTLQEIRPYRRIGVLFNSREIGSKRQLDDVHKFAAQNGMQVIDAHAASPGAVDGVLAGLVEKVDVLVVTESGVVCRQFDKIIARARARNVPVVSSMPDAAEKGALVSLEISPQEQGQLGAELAARILEGTRTDQLSLLSPRRVDLIINLRMAREMGVTVPFPVLSNATRILK